MNIFSRRHPTLPIDGKMNVLCLFLNCSLFIIVWNYNLESMNTETVVNHSQKMTL